MTRWVIGDIHGCGKALRSLLECIQPGSNDEVVFLGDYIDRGPDARDCIDQILELSKTTEVIALRGNHEVMLCGSVIGGLDPSVWIKNGGRATITSYGGKLSGIPEPHRNFFLGLKAHYETESHIFIHAGYLPEIPIHETDDATRYWNHLPFPLPAPHCSGKKVFVGHTPQANFEVLDAGHLLCVDTGCFAGGYLTGYNCDSGEIIQFNARGFQRRPTLAKRIARVWKRS